jgi:hypothetical protein
MRQLVGVGTPRSLQGRLVALFESLKSLILLLHTLCKAICTLLHSATSLINPIARGEDGIDSELKTTSATGC